MCDLCEYLYIRGQYCKYMTGYGFIHAALSQVCHPEYEIEEHEVQRQNEAHGALNAGGQQFPL